MRHFILTLFAVSNLLFCIGKENSFRSSISCGNDSTIISSGYFVDYFNFTRSFSLGISIFDKDSGLSSYCGQNGMPWTNPFCGNGFWDKTDTIYTTTGLVQEILVSEGSLSGWMNKRSVTFTYSMTDKLTGEYERVRNGAAWDSLSVKTYLYDVNDQPIEYNSYFNVLGLWTNDLKTETVYQNDQPYSKVFSHGNGSSWLSDSMFVFTYTGSTRTSLELSYWDTLTSNWQVFSLAPYQLQEGNWSARIVKLIPVIVDSVGAVDTLYYDLDSLDATVYWHSFTYTSIDTVTFYNTEAYIYSYDFDFLNGEYKLMISSEGPYSLEIISGDSTWSGIYRPYVTFYTYDAENHLIDMEQTGGCTNPCGNNAQYFYDFSGFLYQYHEQTWRTTGENNTYVEYSHFNSSDVSIYVPRWDLDPPVCPGSVYQPNLIVAGGCPPYQIHWYPSTGLSSDTITNPVIEVNDSMTYTVIAQDNAGNVDTIQYHVSPVFSTRVDVDSSTCSGPINLSVQNSGNVSYQWYENGQIIPNANLSALEVTHPGDYFVEVTGNYSSDYFQGGICTVQSELIHISGPEIQLSGDTLFTISVADHYEWYLDGTLYSSGVLSYIIPGQTGNYVVVTYDSLGCTGFSASYYYATTNLQNEISESEIYIFPNPASDLISIKIPADNFSAEVIFLDIAGKEIIRKKLNSEDTMFSVADLSRGIYVAVIRLGEKRFYKRVVVGF
ncbi:MAG: T9SS type A sorting domain-containing protein [Bacteroidetes bacterium]|nr:T9SS type A sorting domain-containing protein [Bacteroidota bacterium]